MGVMIKTPEEKPEHFTHPFTVTLHNGLVLYITPLKDQDAMYQIDLLMEGEYSENSYLADNTESLFNGIKIFDAMDIDYSNDPE